MKKEVIVRLHASFEELVQKDEGGGEYWLARDLQELLGYAKWENFAKVIDKARTACQGSGYDPQDHFLDVRKMVELGSGATRAVDDIALTRYACYLIAQNGDPSKEAIAFAQTYFAVQTRKHELIEQRLAEMERLAYIENHALQSGVPHINLGILRKLEVVLPPLLIQQRIAAVLAACRTRTSWPSPARRCWAANARPTPGLATMCRNTTSSRAWKTAPRCRCSTKSACPTC